MSSLSSQTTAWGHAEEYEDISGEVAIAGIGEATYSKASGRTSTEMAAEAVERALEDAGVEPAEVDGLMFSMLDQTFDAKAFREHFGVLCI